MLILGIESSCDETGLALYSKDHGLIAHLVNSQIDLFTEYGGVTVSYTHLTLPTILRV